MKKLKDHIQNNRELFDDQEPQSGHFERFEALLDKHAETVDKKKKPTKKIKLISIISVAASIAILIGIVIGFDPSANITPLENDVENVDSASDEFRATNDYYNQLMDEQIADIMCKLANTDPENQTLLTHDLKQIVDNHKKFVNDIADTDDEEMAIFYLVKHYRVNLQTLENINEKLGKYTKC